MTAAEAGPVARPSTATWLFGAAVAIGVAGNVLAQVAIAASDFAPQLGWMVFDGGAGVIYAVCGALVWWLSPRRTPAVLMVAVSLVWCLGTLGLYLQPLHWSWVLSSGVQGWVDVLAPWIALAYPRGRLEDRFSRVIVAGLLVLYSARSVLRVFFVDAGTWGWCDCVPNPLALPADPELMARLEGVVGLRVHMLLYLLALVVVVVRWARSSAPRRGVAFLMPLAFGAFCAVSFVFDAEALFGMDVSGIDTQLLWPAVVAAVPLAYLIGLLHLREMRGRVVDLVAAAGNGADHAAWEEALATAVGDPRMRLLWWDADAGVHLDSAGRPTDPDDLDPTLVRLPVGTVDRPVALVLHDAALTESRPLLDSLAAALRLAADNERLTHDLQASLQQVQESRARLVEAGDSARRQIERDLHDGSQQRLVSLAIGLRMATARARDTGDPGLVVQLERATAELADALAELRELARGIHPAVLTEDGLEPALQELAARNPVPVDLRVESLGPLPEVVAATAYFTVAEALTNTAKHAAATRCEVTIRCDADQLEVTVVDDGVGGADPDGSGLRGIADRVQALGGTLRISDLAAGGTELTIVLPVTETARAGVRIPSPRPGSAPGIVRAQPGAPDLSERLQRPEGSRRPPGR